MDGLPDYAVFRTDRLFLCFLNRGMVLAKEG